jgi:hypothetical protein
MKNILIKKMANLSVRYVFQMFLTALQIPLSWGATELNDNLGGLLEYVIDHLDIRIIKVSGINPAF